MHFLALVVGADRDRVLAPFADYFEVEPRREYVSDSELSSVAEHFGVPVSDLEELAAKWPEWAEQNAEIHDGRLCYWTTSNPLGKYDWYKVGGNFTGYLHLREPRVPSLLGRLLGKKATVNVSSATKGEVVVEDILSDPPYAVVLNGRWHEQGLGDTAVADVDWQQQVATHLASLTDDDVLTVIDIHS
jgi:hypothetical protein